MKNLLLNVLALVGIIGCNKVLAAVKIPEVDFVTRMISENLTSKEPSNISDPQSSSVPSLPIPNSLVADRNNLSPTQAVGQTKLKLHILERINSLLIPELKIVNKDSSTTDTRQQQLSLQSAKSFTKEKKISDFPKINRSSLIINSPNDREFPSQLSLVNPAPDNKGITSSFGWRIRPYSGQVQFHKGIDYGAPLGSPVVAAGDGIVTKVVSGCVDFGSLSCGQQFGNRIEIDHGNGAIATYGHLLNNSITVTEGTRVWQNQEIAQVGSSGWSSGTHLDFRIEVNGEFQDPKNFVP